MPSADLSSVVWLLPSGASFTHEDEETAVVVNVKGPFTDPAIETKNKTFSWSPRLDSSKILAPSQDFPEADWWLFVITRNLGLCLASSYECHSVGAGKVCPQCVCTVRDHDGSWCIVCSASLISPGGVSVSGQDHCIIHGGKVLSWAVHLGHHDWGFSDLKSISLSF